MKHLSVILIAAVVSATAHAEARPGSWDQWKSSEAPGDKAMVQKIQKAEWWDNCIAWGAASRSKQRPRRFWALQDYLLQAKFINGVDLGGVNERLPAIGMTTCGAVAVLGRPTTVNNTQSVNGLRTQHVFREKRVCV